MRTLRVLRVLKLARYSSGLRKFGYVMHRSKMQLLTAGMAGIVAVMVSSTMVTQVDINLALTSYLSLVFL
jgi:hypothetical protein